MLNVDIWVKWKQITFQLSYVTKFTEELKLTQAYFQLLMDILQLWFADHLKYFSAPRSAKYWFYLDLRTTTGPRSRLWESLTNPILGLCGKRGPFRHRDPLQDPLACKPRIVTQRNIWPWLFTSQVNNVKIKNFPMS
jgi:hypothetical protein